MGALHLAFPTGIGAVARIHGIGACANLTTIRASCQQATSVFNLEKQLGGQSTDVAPYSNASSLLQPIAISVSPIRKTAQCRPYSINLAHYYQTCKTQILFHDVDFA